MIFDLIFTALFLGLSAMKYDLMVKVEKRLRLQTDKWSKPVLHFKSFSEFYRSFNRNFIISFAFFAFFSYFSIVVAGVSSSGISFLFYVAFEHSLSVYVNKNITKFK